MYSRNLFLQSVHNCSQNTYNLGKLSSDVYKRQMYSSQSNNSCMYQHPFSFNFIRKGACSQFIYSCVCHGHIRTRKKTRRGTGLFKEKVFRFLWLSLIHIQMCIRDSARSYPYVSKYSAKDKCIIIHGIFKREKCAYDIR